MPTDRKTLYIIDGHAQIYAAYYAPMSSNLVSDRGEPTKATYIFTTMLLKLLREKKPDLIAVAMDAPGPTFRHELYDQYKANRPAMPDDLPPQIDRIRQILDAMNITTFRIPTFEADDIIGTLAESAATKDLDVVICSKDKDLEQLINPHTIMYDPRSDTTIDADALLDKKGIHPDQVIDALTLQGDTSDNIPGVPDVGPKTAVQWIQKFDTLDNLLKNADQIKGKRGQNLRDALDQLALSRQLVTINKNVPLEFNWDDLTVKPFNNESLEHIFLEVGFRKLLNQLYEDGVSGSDQQPITAQPAAPAIKTQYHLVDTPEAFEKLVSQLQKQTHFAIDTETTSTHPVWAELVGISVCWKAGEAYYLPLRASLGQKCLDRKTVLDNLTPILTNPEVKKTGQNIKYDMIVFKKAGVELAGVDFDTMLASYLIEPDRTRHNLDSLAADYLGHETIKLESLIGKGKNQLTFDEVDTQIAADYAAEDADITWRLRQYLDDRFVDPSLRQLFDQIEMPLVEVLTDMEFNGVAVDVPCLKKLSLNMSSRIEQLTEEIHQQAGCSFNPDSPKQLADVLFNQLGLTSTKKTKTGHSTDQEVLEGLRLQHPIAELMIEYRQLTKLKNTYVDKLPSMIYPPTGRIHASFNQSVTATGRLSSSNPNLQNIPIRSELGREIRKAFIPQNDDFVLLAADYSQIELRMLAHLSGDEALVHAFQTGRDIHQFVASQVFGVDPDQVSSEQRGKAKAVNFGIIYGQTAYGLSRQINFPIDQAQAFIDDYFGRYPKIQQFIENTINNTKKTTYVTTILGRRRNIPDINAKNTNRRKLAERTAVNTVVQGSAADLIKVAMINLHRKIKSEKLPIEMILQVHDELVFELPRSNAAEAGEIITQFMTSAMNLSVPIDVDSGWADNWLDCKT